MKAKLIKIENNESSSFYEIQSQMSFELDKKYKGYSYIYVSHVYVTGIYKRYETLIFPCDKKGEVIDFSELQGSVYNRYITPEDLMRELGYEVIK